MFRVLSVLLLSFGLIVMTAGCAGFLKLDGRKAQSSSLLAYLYPGGERPDHANDDLPQVDLPARVGLAFVPSRQAPVGLSGAERERLLSEVRRSFVRQPFIGRIEIIPEGYLQVGGGWDNLDQLAQLFGVDVIALVSWDQLVQSHETAGSMLYWTLVGAYVVEASRNEVVTLVDTAVLHVPSRNLLFRAPGTDRQGRRSTAINAGRIQSSLARQGFEQALADMTDNLDQAISAFGQRVVSEGQVRLVDRRSGRDWHREHGGAGAGPALPILLLLWFLVSALAPSVRRQP